MSTLFTLTITDQAQQSKAVETQLIHDACLIAAQQVRSMKVATSGTVVIEKGIAVATWTYTGSAGPPG
jgi:hypothetical protein